MRIPSSPRRQFTLLALLSGLATCGCLISEPQELEEAQQVSPRVLYHEVDPPLQVITQTVIVDNERPVFTVPFVSEDLGEDVVGRLFLNYGQESQTFIGSATRTAAGITDVRNMTIGWAVNRSEPSGCYTITMTIAHQSNYPSEPGLEFAGPVDLERAALITWVAAHNIEPHLVDLGECPEPGDTGQ